MSFDLCQVRQAKVPFYLEAVGIGIYSIEELCYYLYENMYLVDASIMNESLCVWLHDELDLKRLARQLGEQLEKQEGIAAFILPIFREIGYLPAARMREYAEKLGKLEVQAADMRRKLKADYLVRGGMFESARSSYWQILDEQKPGSLGTSFYAQVWNNLGCAEARLFRFEEAAECFRRAWELTGNSLMLRKYVSALPLWLSEAEYEEKLKELGADDALVRKIQEHNRRLAQGMAKEKTSAVGDAPGRLEQLKKEYRRSAL